jgi:class 3 adenylate cyclase/tetratricopeptide (TPR) repeat protein
MTFDDILAQVLDLLKRQGRVSYGALKRRFDLDDAYLEDLKDELIHAQRIATDEDGRILVWIGDTTGTAEIASPSAHPTQRTPLQQNQSTPEAERRQLTVMFCDLVESTSLSSQLDPEEYRDVVRAYQRVCSDIITRFDGHIAQLLGDGLLVYFGYPVAHEDDPHRAVRAGLGILAAMGDMNTHLQREKRIQLAIRTGIHTGLVVIGEMGEQGRREQLALGEVPNIASRIEGLAAPNTIAVSEATYRLVEGYFTCEALGEHTLRGVRQPLQVYRVLKASGVTSRLDIAQTRGLTPLVGREQEVGLLLERWAQVKSGQGQVVLLTGEAGIGKSRLVQVLKDHVANEPHIRWECRSSEYYQNTALFPLVDLFQRILRFEAHETPDAKLAKLEHALSQYRLPLEDSVPLFALLLSLPVPETRYPSLNLSPQRQRQKTLETIVAILLELAERQPVLFILEDLHWTDPSSLELLNLLIEQIPTTSILTLLTCRAHFQPPWHHRSYLTEITVNRLSHTQVEQIVARMTNGKALPQEVLVQIVEKTDGVPLFVEEMTKAILESGHLKEVDGCYEGIGSFATFAIPATLQDSLMARLDRLVTAKAVAQYAAVIGRQFSYELLQAVSQVDEVMLQHELGRLVEAEIMYQRGVLPQATYVFKHALIQDAAYESLLKSTRQSYHRRIAAVLVEQFPETAETQPELLAYHYTEAGLQESAVSYWHKAGQRAIERSAHVEAFVHLHKGLEILATRPDTRTRAQAELSLQVALGAALMVTRGPTAPEVERVYTRARTLVRQVGETPQLLHVLGGLRRFYWNRGDTQTARELAEQMLRLAQRTQDPIALPEASYALGLLLLNLGELTAAHTHLAQGMALSEHMENHTAVFLLGRTAVDQGRACGIRMAQVLWLLGYPDQGRHYLQRALHPQQEHLHPSYTQAHVLTFAGWVLQSYRDMASLRPQIRTLVQLCREHEITMFGVIGSIQQGWISTMVEHDAQGIEQMRQGLAALRALGQKSNLSLCFT